MRIYLFVYIRFRYGFSENKQQFARPIWMKTTCCFTRCSFIFVCWNVFWNPPWFLGRKRSLFLGKMMFVEYFPFQFDHRQHLNARLSCWNVSSLFWKVQAQRLFGHILQPLKTNRHFNRYVCVDSSPRVSKHQKLNSCERVDSGSSVIVDFIPIAEFSSRLPHLSETSCIDEAQLFTWLNCLTCFTYHIEMKAVIFLSLCPCPYP